VSHLDDPDLYHRMSPISAVRDISSPVLLLTAENDLRVPPLLANELFVALRLLGRPVELVSFPGETHGLPHSGSPRHRAQRLRAICEFFTRHLF
jgi:dipeptidyl aminopeptidase/acylaminoacyl peptidase